MRTLLAITLCFTFAAARTGSPIPDEGMWLPTEANHGPVLAHLKSMGLQVSGDDLWHPTKPCLADAMVMVGSVPEDLSEGIQGYGSASFVSKQGLVVTNHHVAYDALAALATPEANYVEAGFVAKTMADERHCEGLALQVTTGIEDVTTQILQGVSGDDEMQRIQTIGRNVAKLLEERRRAGSPHCTIKEMRLGTRYVLFTYDVFRDVRMVYAPPRAVGEYGGDIDNWMWPRHCGDFTFLRAYVGKDGTRKGYAKDNVPFEPERWLKVGLGGYQPGDFTFIMGHPGTTYRYRSSHSVEYWQDVNYPAQIQIVKQRIAQLEEEGKASEKRRLELSSDLKSLYNTLKNFQGMVEGMAALDLVARRRATEDAMQAWIDANPSRQEKYGDLFPALEELYGKLKSGDREFMQRFGLLIQPLRRRLVEMVAEYSGRPPYSDANMTLRITGGVVGGYRPKDGVHYTYYTTAPGILEKDTGKAPFDCPKDVRRVIEKEDYGRWADEKLDTLVVNFLTDTDITGGNSGSPIMNAKGEIIGLAFDGNYEAMTSDFKFERDITRTINVDIRYVLWCTEKLAKLDRLLEEMDLR